MRLTLLSTFLLLASILSAQNWAPINTTDIYNYKADTASTISHSLWVDSFEVMAADTFLFTNRIVKHISPTLALKNQHQFLGRQVTNRNNGMQYIMVKDNSDITYYPSQSTGIIFFDATSSPITGYVISVDTATVLGILDSIKTIWLDSGDTIIASKNHGFVQYPVEYGSGKYYRLVGIEGSRNLGEHVLKFDDFFNYAVGDSFWYYTDYWSMECMEFPSQCPVPAIRFIVAIDSIFQNGDTIGLSKTGYNRYPYPIGGTPYLINSNNADINTYPNTIVADSMEYMYSSDLGAITARKDYFYNVPYLFIYENTLSYPTGGGGYFRSASTSMDSSGRMIKVFDKHYARKYNTGGDSLEYIMATMGTKTFTTRLGLTSISFNAFESGARIIMCAYRLAGDTAITILDNYLFTVGIDEAKEYNVEAKLLGNPVSNTINLQLSTSEPHTITLYNLSGQLLLRQQTQDTQTRMDVSGLPQGLYLLEIRNASGVSRERIAKL